MVFAASEATAGDYRRHYVRHSKYDTAIEVSGSGESRADANRLDELARYLVAAGTLTPDAEILDIGAGRGGLLAAFVRLGYGRVAGLDPSEGCVAAMRSSGLFAAVGEIEDEQWATDPRFFDLVVLSHVLEHVFDVADAFERIARRVAPGGAIYIEVPDASRYTTEGFPPYYFFDPEHINHFDAATLAALAGRHGWRAFATWSRMLELEGGQRYPAVGIVLRRATVPAPSGPGASAATVVRYVAESNRLVEHSPCTDMTVRLANDATPVVVWGAGSHAQRLLAQTALARCAIACLIDSDPGKQGRTLAGHRVVAPDTGLAIAEERGATLVVAIAVGASAVVQRVRQARPRLSVVAL